MSAGRFDDRFRDFSFQRRVMIFLKVVLALTFAHGPNSKNGRPEFWVSFLYGAVRQLSGTPGHSSELLLSSENELSKDAHDFW